MHDNSYSINDVNIEINSFQFSDKKHQELVKKDLSDHALDLNKALRDEENRNLVISEMFIESAVLQAISRDMCSTLGHWDYVTHQLIASPFKPLSYIDKIDIYGYRYSQHYQDAPNLVVKYLIVELKKGKINTAALEQTMQYVDWICNEYASGDYSRIEAYVIGSSTVRNIDKIVSEKCERDFIVETHPVKTEKWKNLHIIKYVVDDVVNLERM